MLPIQSVLDHGASATDARSGNADRKLSIDKRGTRLQFQHLHTNSCFRKRPKQITLGNKAKARRETLPWTATSGHSCAKILRSRFVVGIKYGYQGAVSHGSDPSGDGIYVGYLGSRPRLPATGDTENPIQKSVVIAIISLELATLGPGRILESQSSGGYSNGFVGAL